LRRQYCRTGLFNDYNIMCNKEIDTKRVILEAAEAEFLSKGYGNTKMMAIAKRAGVSHSMLHYHFQTKENLFQMIFREKVQMFSQIFEVITEQNLPFTETIRRFIECQFDLVAQNSRLPLFVMNEIMSDKKNLNLVIEVIKPKAVVIFNRLETMLNDEIEKGNVRPVKFINLIMNILAINISFFLVSPLFEEIILPFDKSVKEAIIKDRRESNVQFILKALKP